MMELARAIEIVRAINDRAAFTLGMVEKVGSLEGASLAEMIEATRLVETEDAKSVTQGYSRTFRIIPDDRLIAAAYCAEHYDVSIGTIIILPEQDGDRKALAVVSLGPLAEVD